MSGSPGPGDGPQAGFTLIEIIVAFAVTVLALGALYETFSLGLRSGSAAERQSRALLLAESAMQALALDEGLAAGDGEETAEGGYRVRRRVRQRPDLLAPAAERSALPLPYEVEVEVSWREGRHTRSVSLSTIRLGVAP